VISNVIAKNAERRAYEADNSVGVVARSATVNHSAPRRKPFERERCVTRALSQKREIFRERGKSKSARTALAGTLVRHPPNDPLSFGDGAAVSSEDNNDPRAC
jgi:hypothetical protein